MVCLPIRNLKLACRYSVYYYPFKLVLEHLGEKQFIVKMAVKINDTEYIKVNLNVMFLRLAKGIFR